MPLQWMPQNDKLFLLKRTFYSSQCCLQRKFDNNRKIRRKYFIWEKEKKFRNLSCSGYYGIVFRTIINELIIKCPRSAAAWTVQFNSMTSYHKILLLPNVTIKQKFSLRLIEQFVTCSIFTLHLNLNCCVTVTGGQH